MPINKAETALWGVEGRPHPIGDLQPPDRPLTIRMTKQATDALFDSREFEFPQ